MKLGGKTMLVLAGVITISVALNYAILRTQVFPSFVALEESAADQNLSRVQDALAGEFRSLAATAGDWGHWTDTYQYAGGEYDSYVDDNLYFSSLNAMNLNFMYLFNSSGEVLWGGLFDLESGEELSKDGFLLDTLPPSHALLQHPKLTGTNIGFAVTTHGPVYLVSRAILTNDSEGPSRGSFVIGRILNESEIGRLREQTHVDFQIWPLEGGQLPASEQEATAALGGGQQSLITETVADTLSAYSFLLDPSGKPAILLRADTPRDITAIGQDTIDLALLFMVVVGLIVMVAIWFLLKGVVIGPLSSLTQRVLEIGQRKDRSARLSSDRGDEIGTLAQEFDRMLDELLQKEAMAMLGQITATVSHELRNPLGAMRNSIFAVTESTRGKDLGVERALERVDRNIQRCDDIIGDLMAFAQQKEPDLTTVAIDTWLDKALTELTLPAGVKIASELGAANPEALIDTELFRCAIDKLIENAAQAMSEEVDPEDEGAAGQITVATRLDGDRIRISICDEGPGIPADVLPKVFEPLFSTKGFGVGVGLPTVKRIMDQFGGGVAITSEPGAGTQVELWLPRQQARRVAA